MIVYPDNWEFVGQPVTVGRLEYLVISVLEKIDCCDLSFSGGLDSSVILYYLSHLKTRVRAWTIGLSDDHPDVVYSKRVVELFDNVEHTVFIPTEDEIKLAHLEDDLPGDEAVRLFYKFFSKYGDSIISCDGVDELMCGYYNHQANQTYTTFFYHLKALKMNHLTPLHKNSGDVKVYLPYLNDQFANALLYTPIEYKVDDSSRKKLMVKLAHGKIPDDVINRWKYGFCDALRIK